MGHQELSGLREFEDYEYVSLPSKGECYAHKKARVPVAYLTTADEDIIAGENAKPHGNLSEALLPRKILDSDFQAGDLCCGDRDAIFLWLRRTGFGKDYEVTYLTSENERMHASYDLEKIQPARFSYFADADGLFDYLMGKDKLKYRVLRVKDEQALSKQFSGNENASTDDFLFAALCMQTVSVRGHEEADFIRNYLKRLSGKKKVSYWKFIRFNTPRMETDLIIDDSIFYDVR